MDSGLAALLGAFVGGSLTAGSNIWLEGRRYERAETANAKRDARELRRAARLVRDEIAHSVSVISAAAGDGHWDEADNKELKYNRWAAHQQTLADHLPNDDWVPVSGAYELLYLVVRDAPVGDISEVGPDEFSRVIEVVGAAVAALNSYANAD